MRLDLKMVMSKELGNFVYDTFHQFWKINKYSDVGCLLLMLLDKMVKDKDELKHSNSQLKSHVNGLRASMCALMETLISCSYRADIAEN